MSLQSEAGLNVQNTLLGDNQISLSNSALLLSYDATSAGYI